MLKPLCQLRRSFLSLAIALSLSTVARPAPLEDDLAGLASELVQALRGRQLQRLAVAEFTMISGEKTTLAKYLTDEITIAIVGLERSFEVIDRSHLAAILSEHELSESGLLDPTTAKKLGKLAGVDAILVGTVTQMAPASRLSIKVISVESAQILAASATNLDETALPGLSTKPIASENSLRNSDSSSVPSSQAPVDFPAFENSFLRVELRAVGVSTSESAITITLEFRNTLARGHVHLAAQSSRGRWLTITDNHGQLWKADDLTEMPYHRGQAYIDLAPSDKFVVTGRFTPKRTSSRQNIKFPGNISIAGALRRRSEKQAALYENYVRNSDKHDGQPFSFGISNVRVRTGQGKIGIVIEKDTPSSYLARANSSGGVIVKSAVPGGPSAQADVRAGDIIEKLNGSSVSTGKDVSGAISARPPGTEFRLLLNRLGDRTEIIVRSADYADVYGSQ